MARAVLTGEQRDLVEWGRSVRRDLPWRSTRDAWWVLVSEVMAQQTPVGRVVPFWERFVAQWPTPASLAVADLPDVLAAWKGLGYPRRARRLRQSARMIVDVHGGRVPEDLDDLVALPGVGAYTARAVQAFAFEIDVGPVDTNIARVLARRGGRRLTPREAQHAADDFVPPGWSWDHNQALMDLGALVCRPDPRCTECPIRGDCAMGRGEMELDPAVGSAGVSRPQARFEGSDRQARGVLLDALGVSPVSRVEVAALVGRDDHVAQSIVDGLIEDLLVVEAESTLTLAP